MSRTTIIALPRAMTRIYIATAIAALILMTNCQPLPQDKSGIAPVKPAPVKPAPFKPGRSVVRSQHAMVASSQPLASQVGLEVLKRGGNAVDAAIAMAAMLNVTEPMMTGIGGDAFMLVYWSKTKELKGLNASGRAPTALSLDHFAKTKTTRMPEFGMESITVPGAFDGWVTLLEKYGTMKLADLLSPAIECAENGFPVMEKTAEDWNAEVTRLKQTPAATVNYLIDGRAPRPGEIFRQPNLARTLRTLALGGRDAFYKGEIARAIVDYCEKNGGFISLADLAAQKSDWVEPISTEYRGYTVYEIPPNGQGLTALLTLNILEGFDLAALSAQPDRYYHTLIEATKLAFADRNRYIADPTFSKVPVVELLSKDYAAKRRALIDPNKALDSPPPGEIKESSDTTYFTVVDKDGNAVSFINSLFDAFGSGIVAGDTGIVLQNRGSSFSLDRAHPNHLEPGKRPFHTIIPAMVFKDNKLFMSFGVMGGGIQPQGHVQVLVNIIDLGMELQHAIDAPRYRYMRGKDVLLEDEIPATVIDRLIALGHVRASPPGILRSSMGGGQAIMIDPVNRTLLGASDQRKDGLAIGY
ncbi:MAG TPA: gamma-glutamyltransferase [Candidatus Saccharimonadales bacterium]|nr:gamma-glutamyltransferase [Candidatus Saccharimonadales bacterium]